MKQSLFHADVPAKELLDIVQTIGLDDVFERGDVRFVLLAKRYIPIEMESQPEAVRFAVFHQVFLVQKPADECCIELAFARSVGLDSGGVDSCILPDVVFGEAMLFRIEVQYFLRRSGTGPCCTASG